MLKKRFLHRLQPLFLFVALLFITLLLRAQWATLRSYNWQLRPTWFALSGLFLFLSWGMEIRLWHTLIRWFGGHLPYLSAVRIWFLSAIVRYIPGNLWQPLSMVLYCQRLGISPETTATSVALYQIIILLAVVPIATSYFLLTGNFGLLTTLGQSRYTMWLIGLSIIPVLLFVLRPNWLIGIVNWGLKRIKRPPLYVNLSTGRLCLLLITAMIQWLFWGISFATLTLGLGDEIMQLQPAILIHLVAAYPIAYAIGFISFITPSGLGVREGAFYLLLVPLLDGGLVTVAALVMRLWTTLGEVLLALISAWVHKQDIQSAHAEETHVSPIIMS